MSYYNTTNEVNPTLARYKSINSSQDATILSYFKRRSRSKLTPYDIKRSGILHRRVPIDSIRRSLNTLTNCGELVKLDEMRKECLGRCNHVWALNRVA